MILTEFADAGKIMYFKILHIFYIARTECTANHFQLLLVRIAGNWKLNNRVLDNEPNVSWFYLRFHQQFIMRLNCL